MDPFDEFEFKPLTEGLGFNKKPETLKDQVKSAGLMDEHFGALPTASPRITEDAIPTRPMTFDDVIKSLEKAPLKPSVASRSFFDITEPLPRAKSTAPLPQPPSSASIEKPLPKKATGVETPRPIQSPFPSQDIFRKPGLDFKKTPPPPREAPKAGIRRGAADSPQRRLVPTSTNLPAAALDLIFVMALTLIFLAALLATTKTDLNVVMHGIHSESWTRVSLVVLFLAIMQMYVVISRSFYGCTIGEWTFDVQLGKKEEQKDAIYPVKVIARSFLVTLTGLILLPAASLIMGEDVAGLVSGTQLYEQK